MNPETFHLLNAFYEQTLGKPLESCSLVGFNGQDTVKILWSLNEIFIPHLHRLKTLRYKAQYEPEADEAIKNLVLNGDDWSSLPLTVLRILFERHQQGLLLCIGNATGENQVIAYAPADLNDNTRATFVIAFLLHAMVLPFPVADESQLDIDSMLEYQSNALH
ncbi:hypothetical protein [Salmonella enterica]|uniref:hypothetical protein n=1 Tax=Salmonella enterica TaxID=28901 RepID=UPI0009AFE9C7|nr:hypothetical protein [Salmonella enterica]WGI50470.1 hypothetical protein QBX66_03260 [Salmonella enterica subsp. diarizonae serovar 48:i:z]